MWYDACKIQGFSAYEHASTRNENTGFWGVIARKAKAILEDDDLTPQSEPPARSRWQMADTSTGGQVIIINLVENFILSFYKQKIIMKIENMT